VIVLRGGEYCYVVALLLSCLAISFGSVAILLLARFTDTADGSRQTECDTHSG